ncbi:MAG: helix-turn-helix domain-containing protein [Alphaproteobacteria bacterium]|nr:helix-turn-helix domain-containing protein [Alphaproteobacteria bacterium]
MTVNDAARLWALSPRRVIALLSAGRVAGAVKAGKVWRIPGDAARPYDGRARYAKLERRAKRIVVAGINTELGAAIAKTLRDNGLEVIGFSSVFDRYSDDTHLNLGNLDAMRGAINTVDEYIDGMVIAEDFAASGGGIGFDYDEFSREFREGVLPMNFLVRELVKKMNYESGIVIINPPDTNFVRNIAPHLSELYGVRINSITAAVSARHLADIADDAFLMVTRHKYMTGMDIKLDIDNLTLDARQRSDNMNSARYYATLHRVYTAAKPGDNIWIVSPMSNKVEWTDNAMERQFKQDNLDAAQRGVKMTRIFLFSGRASRKNQKNANIRDYVSNPHINVMWVDTDALRKDAPELLKAIGAGWGGINDEVLLVDLPSGAAGEAYGYVTMNAKDIADAKKHFNELKKFAQRL